jgi:2-oxo-4-hydroxy-4-carboxy-5-ureidoimidazoline decarboxylase
MNPVLAAWNDSDKEKAHADMIACCGAPRWASEMVARRPFASPGEIYAVADQVWATMGEADWLVAFTCHPRIGERAAAHASAQSATWSRQEQASAAGAATPTLDELAELNLRYEQRFGFTYIVCATGKSADEMLSLLKHRVSNGRATELREAAEQQRQIMQIRLRKWLAE